MSAATLERTKIKLQPINDRVVVRRLPAEEVTAGGIIIPDVKKGNRVLFGKYAGQEFEIDGEEYLVMREDDILAVIQ